MMFNFDSSSYTTAQKKVLFSEFFTLLVFSLVFAVLFGKFTSDPKYYGGGKGCIDLLKVANETLEIYVMGAIFYGIIGPLVVIFNTCTLLIDIFRLVFIVEVLAYYGVLCFEYAKSEPCGDLRNLTLGYMIFCGFSIIVSIIVSLLICCGFYLFLRRNEAALASSNSEANKGYNTIESQV